MTKAIRNPDIFCLENGIWWEESQDLPKYSVLPILNILQVENKNKIAHFHCNTIEEFKYNLNLADRKYGILYLAFHGKSGKLLIHDEEITLDELAEIMSKKFKRCGVHFASCETLNITKTAILNFIEKTEVSFVSGYKKSIYWASSAGVDLIYLDCLISNIKNPQRAVEKMRTQIIPSTKNLGFTFIG